MVNFGIATTVIYVAAILWLRWCSFGSLATMPLNELGDFLAGVFGPLTLFWLILGFVQQHKELKQNTEALLLQHKELEKSVKQHAELVATTKAQHATDMEALAQAKMQALKDAQPVFSITSAGINGKYQGKKRFQLRILNTGEAASSVTFSSSPSVSQINSAPVVQHFPKGKDHAIGWKEDISGEAPKILTLCISCLDSIANPYSTEFTMELQDDDRYLLRPPKSEG